MSVNDSVANSDPSAHVFSHLRESATRQKPTIFSIIENFFDEDTYASLIGKWPSFQDVESLKLAKEIYPDRRLLRLSGEQVAAFERQESEVWSMVCTILNSKEMTQTIVKKFPEILLPKLKQASQLTVDVRLCEDLNGYTLGPHTDVSYKLYTLLIYAPVDTDHSHFGTRFYEPREAGFTDTGDSHFDFDQFVEVDAAPYRPNTAVLFPRTDSSFHGVLPLDDPDYVRRSIVVNVYTQS
ncbi:hypothetical protein [uncultured Nisaea sp.]|uniref:hypothetical protein n=1 Tax=uncultured Nisaea sp. TaxID=538215 RepID=UPI0030EB1BB0|tara:strand:+ start:4313 stop:5029 length:717 start_codon:yes stop_codon:yes gene_type:complete